MGEFNRPDLRDIHARLSDLSKQKPGFTIAGENGDGQYLTDNTFSLPDGGTIAVEEVSVNGGEVVQISSTTAIIPGEPVVMTVLTGIYNGPDQYSDLGFLNCQQTELFPGEEFPERSLKAVPKSISDQMIIGNYFTEVDLIKNNPGENIYSYGATLNVAVMNTIDGVLLGSPAMQMHLRIPYFDEVSGRWFEKSQRYDFFKPSLNDTKDIILVDGSRITLTTTCTNGVILSSITHRGNIKWFPEMHTNFVGFLGQKMNEMEERLKNAGRMKKLLFYEQFPRVLYQSEEDSKN